MLEWDSQFFIESDRCFIRFFHDEDIQEFMLYRNDENWMKYQGFKGLSFQEYKKILLGNPSIDSGIQFAIIEKKERKIIGDIFLQRQNHHYFIGYTIAPWFSRQNYGYETVSTFLNFLNKNDIRRVYANVECENEASIRLLEKLGFIKISDDTYVLCNKNDTFIK